MSLQWRLISARSYARWLSLGNSFESIHHRTRYQHFFVILCNIESTISLHRCVMNVLLPPFQMRIVFRSIIPMQFSLNGNINIICKWLMWAFSLNVAIYMYYGYGPVMPTQTRWTYDNKYILLRLYTLRPEQNGRRFAADILECIFLTDKCRYFDLKFVPDGWMNMKQTLFGPMASYRQATSHYRPTLTKFVNVIWRNLASSVFQTAWPGQYQSLYFTSLTNKHWGKSPQPTVMVCHIEAETKRPPFRKRHF